MCGIIGYVGDREAADIVLDGLKKLEYRGYDSAGIATVSDNPGLHVRKGEGEIDAIDDRKDFATMKGFRGIGHTRWATHGGVTTANAHPHTDEEERIAVVHNGIIENFEELKEETDASYESETDTEVIAHFFGERLDRGMSYESIIQAFMERAEGTFAVVVIDEEDDKLYAMRRKSPLAIGLGEDETFVASDIYAFSDYTGEAIFLEDDQYAIIDRSSVQVFAADGSAVEPAVESFTWGQEAGSKEEYDHYMIKEIREQPEAVKRFLTSIAAEQQDDLEQFADAVTDAGKVIFTAAGSSYHAALLGVYFLQRAGIEAQALIASEFKNYERVDEDTLVIAVSQSGETMDVLEALEYSKERGGSIASIVNVPHSSIQRESSVSIEIKAGQEVCVAATKTFTNQVMAMLALAREAGSAVEIDGIAQELNDVIIGNEGQIRALAKELVDRDDMYILGRGASYPIAREIALKLKEIPYIHAEGMMGGELKHGTLALIEDGTPVVSLVPEEGDEILSNVKEVEARGADSIRVSPFYGRFDIPAEESKFALYSTTIGFMLAYFIAKEKGLPIDKPRNLAKSVTVK